ncbi:MAG: hypothetical protein KAH86_07475 [Methanosarcinales archaeon]|nr:hypothetical protein [Methanosarcinales archaeon]
MTKMTKHHVMVIDPKELKEGTCKLIDADWGDKRTKAAVCMEGNKIKIFPVEPELG